MALQGRFYTPSRRRFYLSSTRSIPGREYRNATRRISAIFTTSLKLPIKRKLNDSIFEREGITVKLNTSNTLIIIIMIIIYLFKNYIYVWKRFREKEYLIKMLRRIKKKIVGSKLIFSLKFKNAQSIFITFFLTSR